MKRRSPIGNRIKKSDLLGPAYFAVLAVAIWGPALFDNGYVLLGDMVFTPAMHMPSSLLGPTQGTLNVTLVYGGVWLATRVVGAVILQKAVLFLIAFLSGYLMYRNIPSRNTWARLFAGTVYAVNPFVYVRMLMGQWGMLLGYALLPVAVASMFKTVRDPTAGRCARTALWLASIAVFSLHMGAIALLACAVSACFELYRLRPVRKAAMALALVALLFVALSAFWLFGAIGGDSTLKAIGRADLEAFRTRSTSSAGTGISVMGMYGYWKAAIDSLLPRQHVPLWPVFAFGFMALALYGFLAYIKDTVRGPLAWTMLVLGIAGFFLSLGSNAPITGPVFSWSYEHVAFFRLFREPQKFTALLTLSYAVLGGLAVDRLTAPAEERGRTGASWRTWAVPLLLILAVCFYSFRIFGGLWGEARAVSYPWSWKEAKEYLDSKSGSGRVLYLPPYWYMRFDFTGSDLTITAPMRFYFTNPYIQLNQMIVGGVVIDRGATDAYVQAALESARVQDNLGASLAPLDVDYVLLALNQASQQFEFVLAQDDLEVVKRWDDLVLLRNRVVSARLMQAEGNGYFNGWNELTRRASGRNMTGSRFLESGQTAVPAAEGKPIAFETSLCQALEFGRVDPAGGRWILFSETYDRWWRMNGGRPQRNMDLLCAFETSEAGASNRIVFRNPYIIAGYAVSGCALLSCLVLLALERRRNRHDEGRRNVSESG